MKENHVIRTHLQKYSRQRLQWLQISNNLLGKAPIFQSQCQWLQRFFGNHQLNIQLAQLCSYYKYYKDIPVITGEMWKMMELYWGKSKSHYYKQVKKKLNMVQQQSSQDSLDRNISHTSSRVYLVQQSTFRLPSWIDHSHTVQDILGIMGKTERKPGKYFAKHNNKADKSKNPVSFNKNVSNTKNGVSKNKNSGSNTKISKEATAKHTQSTLKQRQNRQSSMKRHNQSTVFQLGQPTRKQTHKSMSVDKKKSQGSKAKKSSGIQVTMFSPAQPQTHLNYLPRTLNHKKNNKNHRKQTSQTHIPTQNNKARKCKKSQNKCNGNSQEKTITRVSQQKSMLACSKQKEQVKAGRLVNVKAIIERARNKIKGQKTMLMGEYDSRQSQMQSMISASEGARLRR